MQPDPTQPTDPAADTVDGDPVEVAARALSYAMGSDLGPWPEMSAEDQAACREMAATILAALTEHGWADVTALRAVHAEVCRLAGEENRHLRAQVATLTAEKEEFAANYRAVAAERDSAVAEKIAALRRMAAAGHDSIDLMAKRLAERTRERDRAVRERDSLARRCAVRYEATAELGGQLAEVTRERDEARAAAEQWLDVAHRYEMKLAAAPDVIEWAVTLAEADKGRGSAAPRTALFGGFLAAVERYQHPAGTDAPAHVYLSTACYHSEHAYCAGTTRQDGNPKTPAQCKFCGTRCVCGCGHPSPLSSSKPAEQPDTGAQGTDDAEAAETLLAVVGHTFKAARTDTERADVIEALLEGWYELWPDTAVTSPHEAIAGELVRLMRPGADTAQGRTGALEAAIEAAWDTVKVQGWRGQVPKTHVVDHHAIEQAVRAAAPLIEREALERATDALRRADTSGWPGGRGSEVEGCRDAAVRVIESLAASLVVTGEGDRG